MKRYKVVYGIIYIAVLLDYLWMNQQIPFILFIFLTALPVLFKISVLLIAKKIDIKCVLRSACVVNENIGIELKVDYHTNFPIGRIGLKTEYYNVMFRETNVQYVYLEAGDKKSLYYELPFVSQCCGKVRLKVSNLVVYDVLGLTSAKIGKAENFEFTIYPEMKQLEIVQERQPIAKEYGYTYDQTQKGQDVSEVFDIREYVEGDVPKSIHWKLSTKYDDLMVREFSKPANYNTLILLNLGFKRDGNDVTKEQINHILSMSTSMSYSMMIHDFPHHVGVIQNGVLTHDKVDTKENYQDMLDVMMSMEIPDNTEDLTAIISTFESQQFTKMIYVAEAYNEGIAMAISAFADLTIILLEDKKSEVVEDFKTYDVIRIPPESLHNKIQIITI